MHINHLLFLGQATILLFLKNKSFSLDWISLFIFTAFTVLYIFLQFFCTFIFFRFNIFLQNLLYGLLVLYLILREFLKVYCLNLSCKRRNLYCSHYIKVKILRRLLSALTKYKFFQEIYAVYTVNILQLCCISYTI